MKLFLILLSAMLINNYVFVRFLGICPFLGVSKRVSTALGMGLAVLFVLVMSSAISWFLDIALIAMHLEFLRTIVFILIIATFVQFVEAFLKKNNPTLYEALGIYLPLITTNCIILGIAIVNSLSKYNLFEAIFNALGAGMGFLLALIIFSTIRERLELYDIPKPFQNLPISMITASLLSLAFMGFQGMIK
ncbi:MAG: electron transport complex protein RnfA [Fervidobacterium sp.]